MPAGTAFITHEYDEGIAIQEAVVAAAAELAEKHSQRDARQAIKSALAVDRRQLEELRALGKPHGAKGKQEDVARGMASLMDKTLRKAVAKERDDSDIYEAHAVLLSLKRKQLDSAGGMSKTASERGDRKAAAAHRRHLRELKAATKELSDSLAAFAVVIATEPTEQ
jgi:hypothetical protein